MLLIIIVIIILSEKKELEKKKTQRDEQILDDYSELVSKFSLLTLAGLSIYNSLKRIVADYNNSLENGGEVRFIYEEISTTCKQIKNGVYESVAYENMGQRIGLPNYIKFTSFLISGLKRGTSDFQRLIFEEATAAIMEQKANILRKGETASSKLMAPMMLIFVVILILVMVPAFFSMGL